ncbi:hypothetical protein FGB62_146g02 [Gracilaria domingensis]|nr:hypothetical protein FGB62_146g02 [Gracilaria domingensis]
MSRYTYSCTFAGREYVTYPCSRAATGQRGTLSPGWASARTLESALACEEQRFDLNAEQVGRRELSLILGGRSVRQPKRQRRFESGEIRTHAPED